MVSDDPEIVALVRSKGLLPNIVDMLQEWHEPEMQHRILVTLVNLAEGGLLGGADEVVQRELRQALAEAEFDGNPTLEDLAKVILAKLSDEQ